MDPFFLSTSPPHFFPPRQVFFPFKRFKKAGHSWHFVPQAYTKHTTKKSQDFKTLPRSTYTTRTRTLPSPKAQAQAQALLHQALSLTALEPWSPFSSIQPAYRLVICLLTYLL